MTKSVQMNGANRARVVGASEKNEKRAAQLASRIAQDVVKRGWPVGESLGSEPELLKEFGVSRMVFREAVRILEHQQVVRTRRGPGGGVFVTEATVQPVIDTVVLYLYRVDATADEVIDALIVLEEIACELATSRLDDRGLERLRQADAEARSTALPSPRAFHTLLASLTGNPVLELFIDVLNRVLVLYQPDWRKVVTTDGMGKAYAAIGQAIIDHDAALAQRRVKKHLEAARKLLPATSKSLPRSAPFRSNAGSKLSGEVARLIANAVVRRRLQPGDLIGGEEELIEERQVSRDVFREAVRLLEYHRVAEMRRGHGGGLFVLEPSVIPVADITALYLAWAAVEPDDLSELRTEVETATAMLAAERISAAGRSRLREALDHEAATADVPTADTLLDLHAAIAAIAGNPVLELVTVALIRLNRIYQLDRAPKRVRDKVLDEVQRTHAGIAAAVDAGDQAMARSRMRSHLEAIGAVLRSR